MLKHDLALAGIGGNTIAEVDGNLSYPELIQWAAYRQLYPLPTERNEIAIGLQTLWIVSALAGKGAKKLKLADLMASYPLQANTVAEIEVDAGSWAELENALEADEIT